MTQDQENGKSARISADYRHAYPVFAMVFIAVSAALIVRPWFVPETFGRFGFYRAAAMDEEKSRLPRHSGRAACAECHDDVAAIHAKDVHSSIECETCHGAGSKHVKNSDIGMPRADKKDDCLVCHRRLDARPGSFPQIDWEKHYQFVGVKDKDVACVKCHSGHEPLFMDRDMHKARLHPLVHDCGECHVGRTDKSMKRPETHPTIFQCDSCHPELVKSFEGNRHAKLNCKTCHLFIRENSFSGRIVRNADPRFCLLCHRKADFKAETSIATIDWPAHITAVSSDPPDSKRPCVNCHQNQIHTLYPKEKAHGL